MSALDIAFVVVVFAMGASVGSFIGTWSLRKTRGEALLGRSRCDGCAHALSYIQTLPIVSFISCGGRCAYCRSRLDLLQTSSEIGGGLVLASAWLSARSSGPFPERFLLLAILGLILLTIAIHDARTLKIPNLLTLGALGATIALAGVDGVLIGGLLAGCAAFIVLELVRRGFLRLTGRPGLGFGDVKLVAVLAVWLGALTPLAIALAAGLGLIAAFTGARTGRLAFGPWIACGAWVTGLSLGRLV